VLFEQWNEERSAEAGLI